MGEVITTLDYTFTEEQGLIRSAVREWCEKNLTLEKVREVDTKGEFPVKYLKELGKLGIIGMTFPEEHGGQGMDWLTACLVAEELGYADISFVVPVTVMVLFTGWGYIIDKYATEVIRENYVRKACRGEAFLGIATTEAEGGSDVAGQKTTSKKDGEEWVLNGEKTFISGTIECLKIGGGYWLNTKSAPELEHRGITSFFLPLNTPGVDVAKPFEDMGRMGISTGGFVLNNVRLPEEHVLGEVNRGFYHSMEGFDLARLLLSATCIGASQRALDIGMEYIKERHAFGRPIGKYEGIQFELVDDYTELEATRGLIYKTAWMMDEKYKKERFPVTEVSKWVSMCKLKAPHLAFDIFKHTMLWLGAYAYTKECPLEMGLRSVMAYCIGAEGTKNIQRIVIGRELLGREFIPYR